MIRFGLSILILASLSSCTPQVYFLGQQYKPTPEKIDVYYDELDVKHDFSVIGQLSCSSSSSTEEISKAMILEAKTNGGHGIWFLPFDTYDGTHSVKANVLRYK